MTRKFLWAGVVVPIVVATTLMVGVPAVSASSASTRTPADPSYAIDLTGSADGRAWMGTESVTFRNASSLTLSKIWLRLWSNGVVGCTAPAIVVTNVIGGQAGALSRACTALPVTLDHALTPGSSASISMDVSIAVPDRRDRFGYYDGAATLGSALPTLAVHDAAGWHLDPYSDMGESYYSVSGSYHLSLTVPTALKTPTTGQLESATDNGNGTETRTYAASNVRDFEWAAGPFKVLTATDDRGTLLRVSYVPGFISKATAQSALTNGTTSMNRFSTLFGPYPYPEMDIVLSQLGYGMEYPQIIFTIPDPIFVSHELAHQWWMGIVGNDQYGSPWLDESFAMWSEGLPYDQVRECDGPYAWPSKSARITNSMTYWGNHTGAYWVIYDQGACALADAADHLGFAHFVAMLRSYAADHWLGITTTADFKASLRKAAAKWDPGWDVGSYFSEWRIGGSN